MRKVLPVSILGVGVALLLAASVSAQRGQQGPAHLPVGADAPVFAGVAIDGKEYSLKSLTENGSVFVLFWKEVCPHNALATGLFNDIYAAYEGKANFVGFVAANSDGAKKVAGELSIKYPLLPDADMSVVKAYQLRYSIVTLEIKDGKIANVFPGYGNEAMAALNEAMARSLGAEPADVDLSRAPGRLTWG